VREVKTENKGASPFFALARAHAHPRADKAILVPLTNSLYVPGILSDAENVLVDIGTGYFVKKVCTSSPHPRVPLISASQTRPQAIKYYQGKVELLRKNLEALQETIQKRQESLNTVNAVLQQKLQAQAKAGAAA
jgi:prefoldin alpha subunit